MMDLSHRMYNWLAQNHLTLTIMITIRCHSEEDVLALESASSHDFFLTSS